MKDDRNSRPEIIEGEYEIIDDFDIEDQYRPPKKNNHFHINTRSPLVTYLILAANIAMWLIMTLTGFLFNLNMSGQLFLFGAKVNELVAYGQYWRLFTAMFLHIGIAHLFFNSYALFIYGPIVEQLYGKFKFILIYFISGLLGSLLSYMFSPSPAAGASGAIFGLMGSLLYFRKTRRDIYDRIFGPNLFIIIAINLFYGFIQPGIDNWGHIGGLLGGFLVGNAAGLYKQKRFSIKQLFFWIIIIAIFIYGLRYGERKYGIFQLQKYLLNGVLRWRM